MSEIVVLDKSQFEDTIMKALEMAADRFVPSNPYPDVMNLSQVCQYLDITPPTVRERIKTGLPVSYKLGERNPRFVKVEIDRWLKDDL